MCVCVPTQIHPLNKRLFCSQVDHRQQFRCDKMVFTRCCNTTCVSSTSSSSSFDKLKKKKRKREKERGRAWGHGPNGGKVRGLHTLVVLLRLKMDRRDLREVWSETRGSKETNDLQISVYPAMTKLSQEWCLRRCTIYDVLNSVATSHCLPWTAHLAYFSWVLTH